MPAYPSKRRRHKPPSSNPTQDNTTMPSRSGSFEPDEVAVSSVGTQMPQFRRGNLTMVRMKNFLTFDDVILSPGPRMNLIVGPNGSGKSSVVSAVCIALGGKPTILGRNPDLGAYVKFGCSQATLEVWLYEPDSERGYVSVKRTFNTDAKGKYFLDDQPARHRDIHEKVIQKYDIQLDNLTQFMPQEKVAEFTNLRPDELLLLAIRALGGAEREDAFNELLDRDRGLTAAIEKLKHSETKLAELVDKQEVDSEEVKAFREQKELLGKIKLLNAIRPCIEELELRAEYNEVRIEISKVDAEVQEIQVEVQGNSAGPINACKQKVDAASNAFTTMKRAAQGLDGQINQDAQIIEEVVTQLSQKIKRYNDIEMDAQRLQKNVETTREKWISARNKLESFGDVSEDSLEKERVEFEGQRSQVRRKIFDEESKKGPLDVEVRKADQMISHLSRRLEGLMDARRQRLNMVRGMRNGPKILQCVELIDELRSRGAFRRNAFGPVCVEIEVSDRYHARIMEHVAGGYLMTSFVFESMNDSRVFINEARARVHGYSPATITTPLNSNDEIDRNVIERQVIQRPLDEQLRRLGIENTVSDIFSAPASVRAALNAMANIHTIHVGSSIAISNQDALRYEHGVLTWYTPESRCMVSSSSYDSRARNIRVDTDFVNVTGDIYSGSMLQTAQAREELKAKIRNEESKRRAISEEMSSINHSISRLDQTKKDIEEKITDVLHRRKIYREAKSQVLAVQKLHEQIKAKVAHNNVEQEKEKSKDELRQLQRGAVENSSSLTETVKQLFNAISKMDGTMTELICAERELVVEESKYDHLKAKIEEKREVRRALREKRDEIKRQWRSVKDKADESLTSEQWRDYGEYLKPFLEQSLGELDNHIAQMEGQIQGLATGGEAVVQEFEHRQRKIDKLEEEISETKKSLELSQIKIGGRRTEFIQWLHAGIQRMRLKFSELYRRLGCSGDIRLNREDMTNLKDLELQVLVSYRKDVELRPIDAMSNSGGEKMCCTMIFCFSLQLTDERVPPFVMVDELNQGLDPTNEMKIMTMMIEDASEESGPQSFVITPKLLPDLPLTSCTKTHIVYNGPVKGITDLFLAD